MLETDVTPKLCLHPACRFSQSLVAIVGVSAPDYDGGRYHEIPLHDLGMDLLPVAQEIKRNANVRATAAPGRSFIFTASLSGVDRGWRLIGRSYEDCATNLAAAADRGWFPPRILKAIQSEAPFGCSLRRF